MTIPEFPNEATPGNPVTAVDLQTAEGVTLRWTFDTPVQQARIMLALGYLFAGVSNTMPELSLPQDVGALEDTDIWGLESALYHGLQDGYFTDNKEWAEAMAERLSKLREAGASEDPDQAEKDRQATIRENRSRGAMNRTYKHPGGGR